MWSEDYSDNKDKKAIQEIKDKKILQNFELIFPDFNGFNSENTKKWFIKLFFINCIIIIITSGTGPYKNI